MTIEYPRFWFEHLDEVGSWARTLRHDIEDKEAQVHRLEMQILEIKGEIALLHEKAETSARSHWTPEETDAAKSMVEAKA